MVDLAMNIEKNVNELKEVIVKSYISSKTIKNMDGDEFNVLQTSLKVVDDMTELIVEQAMMINNINVKLDSLSRKLDSLSK